VATLAAPPAALGVTHWSARLLADHAIWFLAVVTEPSPSPTAATAWSSTTVGERSAATSHLLRQWLYAEPALQGCRLRIRSMGAISSAVCRESIALRSWSAGPHLYSASSRSNLRLSRRSSRRWAAIERSDVTADRMSNMETCPG
jgi:hypothetical protein